MHRFSNARSLQLLRTASGLYLLFPILWIALVATLVRGLMFDHRESLLASLAIIAALVLLFLLTLGLSGNIRCPLCHVKVFRRTGATMNSRHRKTLLGSPRLYIATRVTFTKHYRCPYCGEPCQTSRARRP